MLSIKASAQAVNLTKPDKVERAATNIYTLQVEEMYRITRFSHS